MIGTILERFESKFAKSDGCWRWIAYKNNDGYGKFMIDGRSQSAHRVAYQLYVGGIPPGMCVCHRCDNPCCVNPAHLFLGTISDNMRDCDNKGRRIGKGGGVSGEKHWNAKLTEAQIIKEAWLLIYAANVIRDTIIKEEGVVNGIDEAGETQRDT